jgi:HK97 family phage portal protein
VSPDAASGHAVALRCIQTMAENLAMVPCRLYKRTEEGRRAADGIRGLSPVELARATFRAALAQQTQAAAQAENAFRPAGMLVFPKPLNEQTMKSFKEAFTQKVIGAAKANEVLVMDGGLEWKPFQIPAKDAEFLESRKLSNLDIARIFGCPLTAVGIPDNATDSNVEQESRALVVRCLAPMARRIEQAMMADLLSAESRRSLFIEHDLQGLLRGDQKARFEAYQIGRQWGWLSANEIRAWENLPAIEGGDEYLSPLNMTPLGVGRAPAVQ